MTSKQFEAFAAYIRERAEAGDTRQQCLALARMVIEVAAKDPLFDRERFLAASGLMR